MTKSFLELVFITKVPLALVFITKVSLVLIFIIKVSLALVLITIKILNKNYKENLKKKYNKEN